GWNAASSPAMLAHLLMARLRGGVFPKSGYRGSREHADTATGRDPGGVFPEPPMMWGGEHAAATPAWIDGWESLTRAEQRARLRFDWWVERYPWEVRRNWWLCLPDGQTPLNAVAAARNALAAGAAGLITPVDPGPERAPLGEHWRVEPFAATLARARAEQRPVLALEQGGTSLAEAELPTRALLLAGHEVHGLSDEHLAACDQVITLPQWGSVNSLNVASAAGLVLDAAPAI
nr:hypothetical protein [Solirubrobacterales bacterium]